MILQSPRVVLKRNRNRRVASSLLENFFSPFLEHEKKKKKRKNRRKAIIQTSDFSTGPLIRCARLLAPRNPGSRKCLSGNRGTSSRQTFPSEARSVSWPCPKNMHEYRSPPFNPRESEGLGAISENVAISPGRFFRLHNFSSCLISHRIPPFPSRLVLPLPPPPSISLSISPRKDGPSTSFASLRSTIPLLSIPLPPSTCCSLLFLFSFLLSRFLSFKYSSSSKKEGVEAVGKHGMDLERVEKKGAAASSSGIVFAPAIPRKRARE